MHFVIVSGWTGSGKSTIADAIGSALPATVLSFDWLMSGLRVFPNVWEHVELPVEHQRAVGWSLLGRAAEQQLRRGGSVVVDLVARQGIVDEWGELAARYGAQMSIVECLCSDETLHRSRVEGRQREIPGWYELTWAQAERGRWTYVPLQEPKLTLDAIRLLADNIADVLAYVRAIDDAATGTDARHPT